MDRQDIAKLDGLGQAQLVADGTCSPSDLVEAVTGESGVDPEKARLRVVQRVRHALQSLRAELPALATHLESHLYTGARCGYLPPAEQRVEWSIVGSAAR